MEVVGLIRPSSDSPLMMSTVAWFLVSILHVNAAVRINLDRRNLRNVPGNIDQLVTDLDLTHNKISQTTNTSFYQYRELRILRLKWNKVVATQDGTFDNNANLEERYVDHDRLIAYLPQ